MTKSAKTKEKEEVLGLLAELAGKRVRDDEVTHEGNRFVVPEHFRGRLGEAAQFLNDLHDQLEQQESFSRTFKYRPWDGAYAVEQVTRQVTGTGGLARTVQTFFGPQPPRRITINVGPNKTEQVLWGVVELPIFEGTMSASASRDEELGLLFQLNITAPRKYAASIEGFFHAVENYLENNSIYRGKAIDAKEDPDFLDTDSVDPSKIVYSQDLRTDLDALVWRFIRDREELAKEGIPFKRAVVLYGPYGTGKTETANITAKACVENGVTFIKVRSGRDDLGTAMKTARLLQPAVVFFEDVDSVAGTDEGNEQTITKLLDLFDGMDAKHNDVMVVLTTNHINRIHKGMMRPGRIDAAVEIGLLDAEGVHQLAVNRLGEHNLSPDIDWSLVFEANKDYTPAFVNEGLKRAYLYRNEERVYTTRDLVAAAEGLRHQYQLMEDAEEVGRDTRLDTAFTNIVRGALDQSRLFDYDEDYMGKIDTSRQDAVS